MTPLERDCRRAFAKTSGPRHIDAAARALVGSGVSETTAFERVAAWFRSEHKKPPLRALEVLLEPPLSIPRLYVAVGFARHKLAGTRHEGTRAAIGSLVLQVYDEQRSPSLEPLLLVAAESTENPRGQPAIIAHAHLCMTLGLALQGKSSTSAQDKAIELFDQARRTLEHAGRAKGRVTEELRGRVLHNHGASLRLHRHGDRLAKLHEALELLNAAAAIPERATVNADIGRTHHELGACLRALALETYDPTLLERAEQAALLAVRPGDSDDAYGSRLVLTNIRVDRLQFRHREGQIDGAELRSAVRDLVEPILPWLKRSKRIPAAAGALQRYESLLEIELDADTLVHRLDHLARKLKRSGGALTFDDAATLLHTLRAWGARPMPQNAWGPMGFALGCIDPDLLGQRMSRELLQLEIRALSIAGATSALSPYVATAVDTLNDRLRDPRLSSQLRRFYASWIRQLSLLQLEWGFGPDGGAEALCARDLSGASAFRADAMFFGCGVADEGSPFGTEARWRVDLFRARSELDIYSEELVRRDLSLPPLGNVIQHYDDNGDLLSRGPIDDSAATVATLRREMEGRIGYGASKSWYPERSPAVPLPQPKSIESWLTAERAILVAGPRSRMTWVTGRTARELPVPDTLEEALREFDSARGRFANPPRLRLADGQVVSAELMPQLSPDQLTGALPDVANETERDAFDTALGDLIETLRPTSETIAELIATDGTASVALLTRRPFGDVPWAFLPVDDGLLGERAAFVHVHTLADLPAWESVATGEVRYAGARQGRDPQIDLGRLILNLDGPLDRVALESQLMGAGRIVLFAHGTYIVWPPEASGLVLDSSSEELESRWQVTEIRSLDLRGCARAELWACQSTFGSDVAGMLHDHDEPVGIGAAFILAGARRVVGSWWNKPGLPAALIAHHFQRHAPVRGDAASDARGLIRAVQDFRNDIGPEGAFTKRLARCFGAPESSSAAQPILQALAEHVGALPPPPGSPSLDGLLGPVASHQQRISSARRAQPDVAAEDVVAPLRGPWAWAGWRVTARDKRQM